VHCHVSLLLSSACRPPSSGRCRWREQHSQCLERSVMFTPSPLDAVTARPADLSGQIQSR
jgi:hypothetical protein